MPLRRPPAVGVTIMAAALAGVLAGCAAVVIALAPTPITLTTGTPGGLYHPVGNAICRLRSPEGVVDFIDVGVGAARWPTFNIADVAVTGGAALLAWALWGEPDDASAPASASAPAALPDPADAP